MPQPNDLSRSLTALDQDSTLIAIIEMSQASWLVGAIVPGIERHPLKKLAPDAEELLQVLQRWGREATKAGHTVKRIAVAFEAGRDGFWLARWLRAHGVEAGACPGEGRGHPCLECCGLARASARQNRPPGCRSVEARLSRLAAGRARSLQDGRDPHARAGRCAAAEPRAGDSGRRAHPHHQPHEEHFGAPWHPQFQAEFARACPREGGGRQSAWRRCARQRE
jgi:hypothetical protein